MGIAASYSTFGVDPSAVKDMAARDSYFAELIDDYQSLVDRIEGGTDGAETDLVRRKARLHDMISDILIAEMA